MAGQKISEYLTPPDYDHFYHLYHGMTEVILSKVINIKNYCEVLKQNYSINPDIFSSADAGTHLNAFLAFSTEFGIAMKVLFWPQQADDSKETTRHSMKRWEPYDESAWDGMVRQVIDTLQPFLQSAKDHHKKLAVCLNNDASSAAPFKTMLTLMERHLDELSRLCNPQEIEAIFRFPSE